MAEKEPAVVSSIVALVRLLDTTRQSWDRWRLKYEGVEINPPWPGRESNGTYIVRKYRDFMEAHNLKNAGNDNATSGATSKSAKEWKADQEEHKARILKAKADTIEGKLLDRDEVTKRLGSMLASFRKALDGIAPRVAKIISSKMDYERKVEIVQHEIDGAMRVMEAADTLAEP